MVLILLDSNRSGIKPGALQDLPGWDKLQTALAPLAKPVPGPDGAPDTRGKPTRDADALVELARRALSCGHWPDAGGEPAR
ncbi:MAG: DUF222 domain-containing protein, partial [Nocardioidaceae bacterium]